MKPFLHPLLPSILAVFALAACSSGSATDPVGVCNELVHDGTTHSVALASNPAPPPVGGAITEGNYVLTAARLFNVPVSVDIQRQLGASLAIRGDVIEQVTQVDGVIARSRFKFTVANTMLSLVDTCAGSNAETHGFGATPTQLEILSPEPGTPYTRHHIFTKR
jgi:hypothetical protein